MFYRTDVPLSTSKRGMLPTGMTTKRRRLMRVGEKGQVTIPIAHRKALGLHAGSEVEFEARGEELVLRKSDSGGRGDRVVSLLRGRSKSGMSTDELLAL